MLQTLTIMVSRNYCFTNYLVEQLLDFSDVPNVKYAIYQLEMCPETNRLHFQGYLELIKPQRYTWIQNNIPGFEGCHLEPRHGSAAQARDYCSKKDGTEIEGPWTYGEMYGQGERMDIAQLKMDVDNNKTDLELWDSHPLAFLRFQKAIQHVRQLKSKTRNWEMENTYIYGAPGLGKSFYADTQLPGAYWKQPGKWWCNYLGEDVILDEFNGYLTWTELLRILDRYPMQVETKGGQVQFLAHKVALTTNKLPSELYSALGHPLLALTRRFKRWIYFYESQLFHEYDNYTAFNDATKHLAAVDHFPANNQAYVQ